MGNVLGRLGAGGIIGKDARRLGVGGLGIISLSKPFISTIGDSMPGKTCIGKGLVIGC